MNEVSTNDPYSGFPAAGYGDVQRMQVLVSLRRGEHGGVKIQFNGRDRDEFKISQHLCLLVFHLEWAGELKPPVAFASTPMQFKDEKGAPIAVPSCLRITRDTDSRCTALIVNTALEVESFRFHAVFVVEGQVVGSPDPTIILEPPPCTGPNCPPVQLPESRHG